MKDKIDQYISNIKEFEKTKEKSENELKKLKKSNENLEKRCVVLQDQIKALSENEKEVEESNFDLPE